MKPFKVYAAFGLEVSVLCPRGFADYDYWTMHIPVDEFWGPKTPQIRSLSQIRNSFAKIQADWLEEKIVAKFGNVSVGLIDGQNEDDRRQVSVVIKFYDLNEQSNIATYRIQAEIGMTEIFKEYIGIVPHHIACVEGEDMWRELQH